MLSPHDTLEARWLAIDREMQETEEAPAPSLFGTSGFGGTNPFQPNNQPERINIQFVETLQSGPGMVKSCYVVMEPEEKVRNRGHCDIMA